MHILKELGIHHPLEAAVSYINLYTLFKRYKFDIKLNAIIPSNDCINHVMKIYYINNLQYNTYKNLFMNIFFVTSELRDAVGDYTITKAIDYINSLIDNKLIVINDITEHDKASIISSILKTNKYIKLNRWYDIDTNNLITDIDLIINDPDAIINNINILVNLYIENIVQSAHDMLSHILQPNAVIVDNIINNIKTSVRYVLNNTVFKTIVFYPTPPGVYNIKYNISSLPTLIGKFSNNDINKNGLILIDGLDNVVIHDLLYPGLDLSDYKYVINYDNNTNLFSDMVSDMIPNLQMYLYNISQTRLNILSML